MEKVEELVKEIYGTISQVTSSRKDEVRIMRAIMNDKTYEVDIYDKNGKTGTFNPSKAMRDMSASIISNTARVSLDEAKSLVEDYEFRKNEAEDMLDISKEFFHTYIHTGRKVGFGGHAKSDIAISLKNVDAGTRSYPKVIGKDDNGNPMYERGVTKVNGYESIRVFAPCPSWIRENKK